MSKIMEEKEEARKDEEESPWCGLGVCSVVVAVYLQLNRKGGNQ